MPGAGNRKPPTLPSSCLVPSRLFILPSRRCVFSLSFRFWYGAPWDAGKLLLFWPRWRQYRLWSQSADSLGADRLSCCCLRVTLRRRPSRTALRGGLESPRRPTLSPLICIVRQDTTRVLSCCRLFSSFSHWPTVHVLMPSKEATISRARAGRKVSRAWGRRVDRVLAQVCRPARSLGPALAFLFLGRDLDYALLHLLS